VKRLLTIGGYGFTEDRFREALQAAGVDTVVDVRQRRGVRGARSAFLNRRRLENLLRTAGIEYVYARELAPSREIRNVQAELDSREGVTKRDRTVLSKAFIDKYEAEILAHFDLKSFLEKMGSRQAVALLCVETLPSACHRSLAAHYISDYTELDGPVEHLLP
jgi:uncharacterized protein (DUF488 family)